MKERRTEKKRLFPDLPGGRKWAFMKRIGSD
jgi:hypothetical protein